MKKKSKKNKKKQKHLNFAHLRRIGKQINIRTYVKIGKRERERERRKKEGMLDEQQLINFAFQRRFLSSFP
jgi:hypothetical protein